MKKTTKDWFIAAEDDLLSAKKLASEVRLTNIVAFHCQQCVEKTFKGIIEELNLSSVSVDDTKQMTNDSVTNNAPSANDQFSDTQITEMK